MNLIRINIVVSILIMIILMCCSGMHKVIKENPDMLIHGNVEPEFADVKTEFIKNFTERGEIGAACCVFVVMQEIMI